MYTHTHTAAAMEAPTTTPSAATSFITDNLNDMAFIRTFVDAYNAQPKKTADPFAVFKALTGCTVETWNADLFTRALIESLNINGLKVKHPLQLPDCGLNLTHTTRAGYKKKEVKPARTFAALAKLVSDDPFRTQMHHIHLDEFVAMATDAHKLLTVQCTYGTRAKIERDAQELFKRANFQSISRGVMFSELEAAQQANADKLAQCNKTVMIKATTGEATDEPPLKWEYIMPTAEATHETILQTKELFNICAAAIDKACNVDKTKVRVLKFSEKDGFSTYVNAQLLLEIVTAMYQIECIWIVLKFEESNTGTKAVRVEGYTGDGMKVEGLVMPIASASYTPLIVETVPIFKS